jgi:acyl-CoA synthetase (AMP-forming)/AMP-acid ligase II
MRLAGRLQRLGLSVGDRVALPLADRLGCVIAHLGVFLAGGVALPLNPKLPAQELRYFLQDSGAGIALVDPEQATSLEQVRADVPSLRHVVADLDANPSPYRRPDLAPDDGCLLVYSSGTTGWPKGVVHSQTGLYSALRALAGCWRMTPDDRVVNVLPLFHVHGLCFATLMPLLAGACVLLEDSFVPQRTLEAISQATVFMAVPTIY